MPYYGVEQWKVVVSRRKKKELPYASYAWTTPGLCLALGGMRRRTQRTPLTGLYAFPSKRLRVDLQRRKQHQNIFAYLPPSGALPHLPRRPPS
jgi:hypothetical protein